MSSSRHRFFPLLLLVCFAPWLAAGDLYWNWRNPLPNGNDFVAATYGKGKFVAVGAGGSIAVSSDGQTWAGAISGVNAALSSVACNGERFIALSTATNQVLVSIDGSGWVLGTNSSWPGQTVTRATGGAGRFVVVGRSGYVAWSEDAQAWTVAALGTANHFVDVSYGDGGFMAVTNAGEIFTSADGATWQSRGKVHAPDSLARLCYGGGHWVLLSQGHVSTSTDGAAWSEQDIVSNGQPVQALSAVAYFSGRFYLAGGTLETYSSADGTSWQPQAQLPVPAGTTLILNALAAGGGRLVVAGRYGVIFSTKDGVFWTSRSSSTVSGNLQDIAHAENQWIAAGTEGLARSADGVSWQMIPGTEIYDGGSVAYGNGTWVAAGGWSRTVAVMASGVGVSTDGGLTWTRYQPFPNPIGGLVYGNGRFVACTYASYTEATGRRYSELVTSTDGVTWEGNFRIPGDENGGGWSTVTFVDGKFYARGSNDPMGGNLQVASSTDGVHWEIISAIADDIRAMTGRPAKADQPGVFVAAGLYGDIWTSVDARDWTNRGRPVQAAGPISSLTVVDDGFVGCTSFGKIVTSLDGVTWKIDDFAGTGMMNRIATAMDDVVAVGNGGAIWQVGRARFVNNATRSRVQAGSGLLIMGFVITGTQPKTMLLRGIGPALANYQVASPLSQPTLKIYDTTSGNLLASNAGWSAATNAEAAALAAKQVGAFALVPGSKDSALLLTLKPGIYSANVVSAIPGEEGVALVEAYEIGSNDSRIVNMSTRANVGVGADVLIPGLVITGDAPRTVLVRAVGPTLASFGVTNPLARPVLKLLSGTSVIASNAEWGNAANAAEVADAAKRTGAFALPLGSADSALLVTVSPGVYSFQVSGAGDTSGVALVEVYEMP